MPSPTGNATRLGAITAGIIPPLLDSGHRTARTSPGLANGLSAWM